MYRRHESNAVQVEIKLSTVDLLILILTVIPLTPFPHYLQLVVEYGGILYLLCRYLPRREVFKNNKVVFSLLLAYTIILTYSTYVNNASFTWTLSAFMQGMQYLTMFLVLSVQSRSRGFDAVVRKVSNIIAMLIAVNDLLIPLFKFNAASGSIDDRQYLLGNKFSVSYVHAMYGAMLLVRMKGDPKKRGSCAAWFIYSMIISAIVKNSSGMCVTGLIVNAVMLLMLFMPGAIMWIMERPLTFPVVLAIENILIWSSINILYQPWMQNIVVNVFHKLPSITGREGLYNATMAFVLDKPLFGYGESAQIYKIMFDYGNAQNGLFDIVIQAGIIGAIIYFLMITLALKNRHKENHVYGLYMFVYAMLLGSAVEINLSGLFLLGVAMINASQISPEYSQVAKKVVVWEERELPQRI